MSARSIGGQRRVSRRSWRVGLRDEIADGDFEIGWRGAIIDLIAEDDAACRCCCCTGECG
mgnify:CR=1 FL=1